MTLGNHCFMSGIETEILFLPQGRKLRQLRCWVLRIYCCISCLVMLIVTYRYRLDPSFSYCSDQSWLMRGPGKRIWEMEKWTLLIFCLTPNVKIFKDKAGIWCGKTFRHKNDSHEGRSFKISQIPRSRKHTIPTKGCRRKHQGGRRWTEGNAERPFTVVAAGRNMWDRVNRFRTGWFE